MKIIDIFNDVLNKIDDIVYVRIQEFCSKTRTDIKDIILLEQLDVGSVIYYVIRKEIYNELKTDNEIIEHSIPLCKIKYVFD